MTLRSSPYIPMPYITIPSVHPYVGRSHGWAESGVVRLCNWWNNQSSTETNFWGISKTWQNIRKKSSACLIQHNSILRSAFVAKVAAKLASLSPTNKSFSTADNNNASRRSWLIVDLSFDFTRASLEKLSSTEAVVTGSVNRTSYKKTYMNVRFR